MQEARQIRASRNIAQHGRPRGRALNEAGDDQVAYKSGVAFLAFARRETTKNQHRAIVAPLYCDLSYYRRTCPARRGKKETNQHPIPNIFDEVQKASAFAGFVGPMIDDELV